MVWINISILLFVVGAVCMYLFSLIAESNVGKWFLINGLACIAAGLVFLYIVFW